MTRKQPNGRLKADPEIDPTTGMPLPKGDPAPPGAPRADARIRIAGLVAAILLVIAAAIWYFGDQRLSIPVIAFIVLAAIAALAQTILVLREFSRRG
jgi:hypothetical protein